MSIVETLILISLLVIIHELGHFWAARMFGVRILEFSVGFGPMLASTMRGETRYSLRAIPLGGFTKMDGMEMIVEGEGGHSQEIDKGSFRNKAVWQKIIILLAGPVCNLLIAALTLVIMLAAVGVPQSVETRAIIGNVEPKSPGYEAGLTAGDEIKAVNGKPVASWNELVDAIRGTSGEPVTLLVDRSGQEMQRTITPFYDPETKSYRLGIYQKMYFERMSLGKAVYNGCTSVYWASIGIVQTIARALKGEARVSLSGPIGVIGAVGESIKAGPWWLLQLIASISIFLALFNLLPVPLPLLDGGWVVIFLIEGIRRREFSAEQKSAAQFFGLIIMVSFFLFVTYGDLVTGVRRFLNR